MEVTMKSIIYVGMDVHSTNYTLASFMFGNEQPFAVTQVDPDYKHILNYLKQVQKNYGGPCEFLCGYEAGCLGFTGVLHLPHSKNVSAPMPHMASGMSIPMNIYVA